jgi:drug/metabolite transporter (DMT)-like permease
MGNLGIIMAALLWGLWPAWIRGGAGGATTAMVAMATAALVGMPLALRQSGGHARDRRAWGLLALLGVADAANVWCYFRALDEGAVAPAVLSHYLAPVLVAVLAPRLLGEPRSPRTPLALVLAVAGTAALVFGSGGGGAASERAVAAALLFGGASAVFYAANVLISKALGKSFGDAEILCYHLLLASLVVFAVEGFRLPAPSQLTRPALGGLVSTLVAGLAYYYGLRRIPAERAAILSYLEPLAAMLVGWVILAEPPSYAALAGGALILAGGLLVAWQPRR